MTHEQSGGLIAADVGNNAIKLAPFEISEDGPQAGSRVEFKLDGGYPVIVDRQDIRSLAGADLLPTRLEALLLQLPPLPCNWYVASVNRQLEKQLAGWVGKRRPEDSYLVLGYQHFPQPIDVRAPARVGTDRLAAAVAANELRAPARPAIVVDAGTAITIDLVSGDGVFRGGVILPGLDTAAAALASATDALPLVERLDFSAAPHHSIGRSTEEAIRNGIVWGCVGAIREHITRITAALPMLPEIYCTGGDGPHLAQLFGGELKFEPNLVLQGIALTGLRHLQTRTT